MLENFEYRLEQLLLGVGSLKNVQVFSKISNRKLLISEMVVAVAPLQTASSSLPKSCIHNLWRSLDSSNKFKCLAQCFCPASSSSWSTPSKIVCFKSCCNWVSFFYSKMFGWNLTKEEMYTQTKVRLTLLWKSHFFCQTRHLGFLVNGYVNFCTRAWCFAHVTEKQNKGCRGWLLVLRNEKTMITFLRV